MDLIDQLGGTMAVAKALGIRHGAVANWRKRGVPDGAKWRLMKLARDRGIAVEPEALESLLPKKVV